MSLITTHVLDTTVGKPAAGIVVTLDYYEGAAGSWMVVDEGKTDTDGRLQNLIFQNKPQTGLYRLRFDTSGRSQFFPEVVVHFMVSDVQQHYHIPLLLTNFGYSTYRGS